MINLKEFQFGNTTVRIHSPLVHMTAEERRRFYKEELAKGNVVLKEIEKAVIESYWKRNGIAPEGKK